MSNIARLASRIRLVEEALEDLKDRYRVAKAQAKGQEAPAKGKATTTMKKKIDPKKAIEDAAKGKKKACVGCRESRVASIRKMVAADLADIDAANRNNQAVKKMIPGGEGKNSGDAGRISQHYLSEMKEKFAPQVKLASICRDLDHLSLALEKHGYNRFAGMLAEAASDLADAVEAKKGKEEVEVEDTVEDSEGEGELESEDFEVEDEVEDEGEDEGGEEVVEDEEAAAFASDDDDEDVEL